MSNDRHPPNDPRPGNLLRFEAELTARERLEADLSALVDGELETERLLEVVDRLLDEPAAQRFYRRARALSGMVEAVDAAVRTEAPPEVWRRIAGAVAPNTGSEEATEPQPRNGGAWRTRERRTFGAHLPGWAAFAVAAALLVAVLATGWLLRRDTGSLREPAQAADAIASVDVGQGNMTDSRFVQIATELLSADRHYRREMVDIIQTVEADLPAEMGSSEDERPNEGVERSLDNPELDPTEASRRRENVDLRIF